MFQLIGMLICALHSCTSVCKAESEALTQQLLYDVQLVNVTVTRKEGLAINEFSHDATNCPHVNLLAIVAAAQEQLWSSVPPAHLCHVVSNGGCATPY